MSAAKITQLHVYIIGGVLLLIIGLGLYFTLLKPLNEENTVLASSITSTEGTGVQVDGKSFTISQASAAAEALQQAEQRRDKNEARLRALEAKYQVGPRERIVLAQTDDEILKVTMSRWLQLPKVVVTLMENHAQKLAKKHGITVQTAFAAPASVPAPTAIPTDIITYPLGGMAIRGNFTKVMAWVKDWDNAPLLVSIDGLKCQLAGQKGEVAASCALTAYVFPTGPRVVIPGAGGGAGAAAAGMGGGMGGMDSGAGAYAAPGAGMPDSGAAGAPGMPGNGP